MPTTSEREEVRGVATSVAGIVRPGYDLELRRYDGQGWRAVFCPKGFEHSLLSPPERGHRGRGRGNTNPVVSGPKGET